MQSLVGNISINETIENNVQNNEKQIEHNGHNYSIGSNELPNAEELVKKNY